MNGWAADLIGQEVADRVGKVWGLGSDTTKDPGPWEGEQRNMWKPTQQEALWFHGGNLHQSRHYSLYLALQLKARSEGIPTPVYGAAGGAPPAVAGDRCSDRCGEVAAITTIWPHPPVHGAPATEVSSGTTPGRRAHAPPARRSSAPRPARTATTPTRSPR